MALKDKHLADGEEIRLDLRTHWKALAGPLLLLVVLVAAVVAVAVLTRDSDQSTWILLAVAVIVTAAIVASEATTSASGDRLNVWPPRVRSTSWSLPRLPRTRKAAKASASRTRRAPRISTRASVVGARPGGRTLRAGSPL